MNTDMNKDQEKLDETRVMERLTDETTVIDMEKIRNEQNQPKKKDDKEESTLFSFLKEVFISFAVVLIVVNFVVRPIQVKGSSMYNTLEDGYFGFSDLLGYRLTGLKRFDIVIVYLAEKKEYLIKRVIGLPGETVEYRNNQLYMRLIQVLILVHSRVILRQRNLERMNISAWEIIAHILLTHATMVHSTSLTLYLRVCL